ncbi:MAG: hypothetical protein AAB250_12075, partial [Bdellovibrionota bacterium]
SAFVATFVAVPAFAQFFPQTLGVRESKAVVSDGRRGGGQLMKVLHVMMIERGELKELVIPTNIPAGAEEVPMRTVPLRSPISVANGAGDLKLGEMSIQNLPESAVLKRLLANGGVGLGIRAGTRHTSNGRRGGGQIEPTANILILRGETLSEVIVPLGWGGQLGSIDQAEVIEHKLSYEAAQLFAKSRRVLGIRDSQHFEAGHLRGMSTVVKTVNVLVTDGAEMREIMITKNPDSSSSLNVKEIAQGELMADPISRTLSRSGVILGSREGSTHISDGRRGGGVTVKTTDVMTFDRGHMREFSIPIADEKPMADKAKLVDHGPASLQPRASCEGLF